MRQQRVRDRKVGGKRQRSILEFRFPLRAEGEGEAAVRAEDKLLLRRVHPRGAAGILGLLDTAGKLEEVRRQLGWRYGFISELGARS